MKKKPAGDNSKGRKSQKKSNVPKKEGNMEDKEQKRCDSSNEESEREIKKDDQSNESHDKPAPVIKLKRDLTKGEKLISLLKKGNWTVPALQQALNTDSHTLYDLAEELAHRGFDIRVIGNKEEKIFSLIKGEDVDGEAVSIVAANKKFKIGFVSEIRMGAKQSQISLLHWIYKEIFEKEDVDFVVVLGGLVIGKPTPTLMPDALKTDADSLVEYVAKHYPKSKKFKTYIVSGRAELSWKTKDGFDIVSAICNQREDMLKAGDLEKTFEVKGVFIKTISPFDDNCPKSISYGPQGIADKLKENPMPHILVVGSTHRRQRLPVYNGMYIEMLPALHTQMRRQVRKKVSPYIGCTILELNYNSDWTINLGAGGLRADMYRLEDYVVSNDCYGVDLGIAKNFSEDEKKTLDWFIKERILSLGEISRRLKQNKESAEKIVKKLQKCYPIQLKDDSKRYELEMREKEVFSPLPIKREDVFVWATKEAGISDSHLGSIHDLPKILRKAYEDAAKAGARRVYNAGDATEGPGSSGYRGHLFDMRPGCIELDSLLNYAFVNWPKDVKIKIDPKHPVLVTERVDNDDGTISYKEILVKDGEVILQTDVIEGNHDGWAHKTIGTKVLRSLAIRMSNQIRYIGYSYGSVTVDGVYHKLIHPEGGGGTCFSNVVEKHLKKVRESNESGGFATIVYIGHFHSAYLLFDTRLGIRMPCVKDEDDFHETHALLPYIGMFLTEIFLDKSGKNMTRVISEYRDYYPQVKKESVKKTRF